MTDQPAGADESQEQPPPAAAASPAVPTVPMAAATPLPPVAAPSPVGTAQTPPPPVATVPVLPPIDAAAAAGAVVTRAGSWFAGLDPRGWRTTLVAAALMIGVVAGVNIVNAAVPLPTDFGPVDPGPVVPGGPTLEPGEPTPMPVDPGPVQPGTGLEVGAGVVVYPPDGWTVVGSQSGQVAIQKAGAIIIVIGIPWTVSPAELATAYRDEFFTTGQFTAAEPETGEVGNGIPAVALSYTGVLEGTQVDGAIFAGATGGSGVVANVFAAKGGLQGLGGDVDALLSSIQVTGGGQ